MLRAIADNGQCVLAEEDGRLLFLARRGLVPGWAVYVVGLLTAIFGVNSVVLIGFGVRHHDVRVFVGLGMMIAAGLLGWACVTLARRRIARREAALDPGAALLVIDLEAGLLRDASGRELVAIDSAKFVRRMQLTSSSRALHVVWSGNERVLYRGDAFTGPIDDAVDALERRGIRVS